MDAALGMSSSEAAARLVRDGPNELTRDPQKGVWSLIRAQLASPLILLLAGACALSAAVGEWVDAIAILAIVLLNATVGFVQEYRAEQALAALRKMTAPRARVRRDGHAAVVPAARVVVGDVLLLEAGDLVAADARLRQAHVLSANEAPLTGESLPVHKSATPVDPGTPLAERADHVFTGTAIATGSGEAEVVATGMRTELGRIARLITTAQDSKTPLELRLAQVSRMLMWLCLGVVAVVAVIGLWRQEPWMQVLMFSVSLAVAAVPEGLPAVVTIALAVGVQKMAARNVLVRRLQAVETLGTATVVCTDKTGTLTTGEMRVRRLWTRDERRLLDAAAACCDAELAPQGELGTGDPTEVALLLAARERGIERAQLEEARPRTDVRPFDSDRKRMSIRRADGVLYVKGAVDLLLPLCVSGTDGAEAANHELAAAGLRVLGVAVGRGREEKALELLGMVGIADPPRAEARDALESARRAGVKTVMITGDHPDTAAAIARELGLVQPGEPLEGRVFARATAEDKLRLVRELKGRGEVVAMTGDGVNDAPALREAHIGVAMGKTGTEVSREAADLVLADDNYVSLIAAVQEGRAIYDNIRKALLYLLAGNSGELFLVLAASIAGLPLPLLALHLLWVNLITDSLPALALVVDPPAKDLLRRPPRRPDEPLLGRREWVRTALTAVLEGGGVLVAYTLTLRASGELAAARTVALLTLVTAEVLRVFSARSDRELLWEVGPFTNPRLIGAVAISLLLQLVLYSVPATRELFGLVTVGARELGLVALAAFFPVSIIELSKLLFRIRDRRPAV